MARRRKPINFELINSGDKSEIRRVLDDLRLKRPCGPEQNLHAHNYEDRSWETPTLRGNPDTMTLDVQGGGYTDLQLFQVAKAVGIEGDSVSNWDLRWKLDNVWPDIRKAGLTRRTNRIAGRLSGPYRRAIREGKVGESVFRVRMQRDHEAYHLRGRADVFVNAIGQNEAETVANTLFGYACGHAAHAEFVSTGGMGDCVAGNEKTRNILHKQIVKAHAEIKKAQEQIEAWETSREALGMFTLSRMSENEDI